MSASVPSKPHRFFRIAAWIDAASLESRFFAGLLAGFLPALAWVVLYLAVVGASGDDLRWFWGNCTYSIHHLLVMPVCMAVFAATARPGLFLWESQYSRWRTVLARSLTPLVLLGLMTFLVIVDARAGSLSPYMLKQGERAAAVRYELLLRGRGDPSWAEAKFTPEERLTNYKRLLRVGDPDAWLHRGPVGWANVVATWWYAVFVLTVSWYLFLLLCEATVRRLERRAADPPAAGGGAPAYPVPMIFVYGLLLTWFPLRVYANWFEDAFWKTDWETQHAALTLIGILAFSGLILLVSLSYLDRLPAALGALGGALGVVGAVAGWVQPQWMGWVAKFFNALHVEHYLLLAVIVLPVLIVIGLFVSASLRRA